MYAVSLLLGVGGALFQPAFLAAMPNLVPTPATQANALVGLTQSLAVMVGFPLGGLIVDQFGVAWGFTANALSFAVLRRARRRAPCSPPCAAPASRSRLITELGEGFRYVRGNRDPALVIVVVALITLAAGIKSPLESLFALNSLDAGRPGSACSARCGAAA